MFNHVSEIVEASKKENKPISQLIIEQETENSGLSEQEVWNKMKYNLSTMQAAVKRGQEGNGVFSKTGLTGGEAVKIKNYRKKGNTLSGDTIMQAVQNAIATNEVNASYGDYLCHPYRWFFWNSSRSAFHVTETYESNRRAND